MKVSEFTSYVRTLEQQIDELSLEVYNLRNPLNESQITVLQDRYFLKEGDVEETTWQQIANRVAIFIAIGIINRHDKETMAGEDLYALLNKLHKIFFKVISARMFMPNTPTLFNAGIGLLHLKSACKEVLLHTHYEDMFLQDYLDLYNEWESKKPDTMLSACFTIPTKDDIDDIFDSAKKLAKIAKTGGGVGINLSKLRPKDSSVGTTGGVASGAVSFLEVFNTAGEVIKQGGKRRAAIMALLNYNHPDIEEFIDCKLNNTGKNKLSTMNISVNFSDVGNFLWHYERDEPYIARHSFGNIKEINPRKLLDRMAENSHKTGDPGFIMLGKHNAKYPLSNLEPIDLVNPCGEEPLRPYSSCTLGHINLAAITILTEDSHDNKFTRDSTDKFLEVVNLMSSIGVVFLNLVNIMNVFPIPEIAEEVKKVNPIGLGYLGLGETFYRFKVKYGTPISEDITALITGQMALSSYITSMFMAKTLDMTYPLFEYGRYDEYDFSTITPYKPNDSGFKESFDYINNQFKDIFRLMRDGKATIANSQLNTLAPTGSTGWLAGTTTGIEPDFNVYYKRNMTAKDGSNVELFYLNNVLKEELDWVQLKRLKDGEDLKDIIGYDNVFVGAMDIDPMEHLKIQEAAQYYVDASISKTINLPKDATVETIKELYLAALKSPVLKGITIYRDGSLDTQVLETIKSNSTKIAKRPKKMGAAVEEFENERGKTFVTLTYNKHRVPFDVFIHDGDEKAEIIGRLGSLLLRHGADIYTLVDQLSKVKAGKYSNEVSGYIESMLDDMGLVELDYEPVVEENEDFRKSGDNICPNCGGNLIREGGCINCPDCGYSRCL